MIQNYLQNLQNFWQVDKNVNLSGNKKSKCKDCPVWTEVVIPNTLLWKNVCVNQMLDYKS